MYIDDDKVWNRDIIIKMFIIYVPFLEKEEKKITLYTFENYSYIY